MTASEVLEADADIREAADRYLKSTKTPWFKAKQKAIWSMKYLMSETPLKAFSQLPSPKNSARLGRELMNTYTDDFVARSLLTAFIVDYATMPPLYAFVGDRANPDKPDKLTVDGSSLLFTNRQVVGELGEQIFIYLFPALARQLLMFGKLSMTPNEYGSMIEEDLTRTIGQDGEPTARADQEVFTESLDAYMKASMDLREMKYGDIMLKVFARRMQTIHLSMVYSLTFLSIGGLTLSQALPAFVFLSFLAPWYFGWMWVLLDQGLSKHEDALKDRWEVFSGLLKEADWHIRSRDFSSASIALSKIIDLYPERLLPLGDSRETWKSRLASLENLDPALIIGLQNSITQTPPVPKDPSPALMYTTKTIGALATTIVATYLSTAVFESTSFDVVLPSIGISMVLYTLAYYGLDYWIPSAQDKIRTILARPKPQNWNICRDILLGVK